MIELRPAAILLAISAGACTAAPTSGVPNTDIRAGPMGALNLIQCGEDQLFVIQKDGRELYWPVASSFGNTTGCIDKPPQRLELEASRMRNLETTIEVDDGEITASVFGRDLPDSPPAFSELWDNIQSGCNFRALCTTEFVTPNVQLPPAFRGQLRMRARGNFAAAEAGIIQDEYSQLVREAFDATVSPVRRGNEQIHEDASKALLASSSLPNLSGTFLLVEFDDNTSNTHPCDGPVSAINNIAGSLVPQLGPLFGAIGAICDLVNPPE
ncbi:hypothetical protein Slin15195_G000740 [Septoria linicola]|uniref:Uncharacterized protein n=1 Tax=Septoria linicola TaxID=215465 RepID=A0A9Q9EDG2_9PEZI|nr:hypothetical protein Slin15195_G000740 [Septoria linicola]